MILLSLESLHPSIETDLKLAEQLVLLLLLDLHESASCSSLSTMGFYCFGLQHHLSLSWRPGLSSLLRGMILKHVCDFIHKADGQWDLPLKLVEFRRV